MRGQNGSQTPEIAVPRSSADNPATHQVLPETVASEVLAGDRGNDDAQAWTQYLAQAGQTTALCLARTAAVASWHTLMGPSDPQEV